ncbi:hypothetical protein F7310_05055 [Francisella uliginis]|uniref:Uncharacterized protein n=1 Tax=Francisella uliginis TaxID=573570 RepID=A0A1L4BSE3_9GAMM|nr:hypothetical protein F7310_05055 [Francisella uliginis]
MFICLFGDYKAIGTNLYDFKKFLSFDNLIYVVNLLVAYIFLNEVRDSQINKFLFNLFFSLFMIFVTMFIIQAFTKAAAQANFIFITVYMEICFIVGIFFLFSGKVKIAFYSISLLFLYLFNTYSFYNQNIIINSSVKVIMSNGAVNKGFMISNEFLYYVILFLVGIIVLLEIFSIVINLRNSNR